MVVRGECGEKNKELVWNESDVSAPFHGVVDDVSRPTLPCS